MILSFDADLNDIHIFTRQDTQKTEEQIKRTYYSLLKTDVDQYVCYCHSFFPSHEWYHCRPQTCIGSSIYWIDIVVCRMCGDSVYKLYVDIIGQEEL